MRAMALVTACLFWSTASFSADQVNGFENGNDLYTRCISADVQYVAYCSGYVAAMTDILNAQRGACPPAQMPLKQSVDIVTNYLRDHPETRHYAAWQQGFKAISAAFPCR